MMKRFGFVGAIVFTFSFLLNTDQTEQVFTSYYQKGTYWTGETFCGWGSSMFATRIVRQELPKIFEQFQIKSMLDIPCGDFHWMKNVPLDLEYIGADIVKKLVEENKRKYETDKREFLYLDIIKDDLPQVDLIFCRDCLIHLSNAQVLNALKNIKRSGSTYLMTTCYLGTKKNTDIKVGGFHPLNLLIEPFNLPRPIFILNERIERDKNLVLWKIEDIDI